MERLIKLQLKDMSINNLSVLLYKSYKTAVFTPLSPIYVLTERDDSSQDAINYYRLNFSNYLNCITEEDVSVESVDALSTHSEGDKVDAVDEPLIPVSTLVGDDSTEDSDDNDLEMNDEEVKLKLDLEVEVAKIKDAIHSVNPKAQFGRKGKSTIINEFYDDYKAVLVALIK